MPGVARRALASSVTGPTLRAFGEALDAFHRELAARGDDHARFEFMLDQMWDVFTSRNVEFDALTGELAQVFELDDNLDSGNAMGDPFPPFARAFRNAVADTDRYRMYHGPWPIDGLAPAVLAALVREGIIDETHVPALDVGVGAGTVNLWDGVCRLLICRPGDVITVPAVTYGFFLPQVQRVRGRLKMLPVGEAGKPDICRVGEAIDAQNAELMDRWQTALGARVACYVADLEGAGIVASKHPTPAEVRSLQHRLAAASRPADADEVLEQFVRGTLLEEDGRSWELVRRLNWPSPLAPPRVVGYLHINPNLFGASFSEREVADLAHVLSARHVVAIEDIAYHSIRLPLRSTSSLLRHDVHTIVLLGLSKPFCIADCRAGIIVSDTATTRQVLRAVESSIGWVPTFVQEGIRALFAASPEELEAYFHETDSGYAAKRILAIACLEGIRSERLSATESERSAAVIRASVDRLFASKRTAGVNVVDDTVLGGRVSYEGEITRRFLAEGLRRWLRLEHDPDAGFFVITDCTPLLSRFPLAGVDLSCSFDVFALFAYLFGVRTIPEETMGRIHHGTKCSRLRLTFSPPIDVLVQALFTIYVGLDQLERWSESLSVEGQDVSGLS